MSLVVRVTALVCLWVLLWGDLSAANILSGIVVAAAVIGLFPITRGHRRTVVRPGPAVRLAGAVLADLAVSNVLLTRDVLRRRPDLGADLVECRLSSGAPWVAGLLANLLALTPGMMPVEVDVDAHLLRLHDLRVDDHDRVRAKVTRWESLVVRAFGTVDEIGALG